MGEHWLIDMDDQDSPYLLCSGPSPAGSAVVVRYADNADLSYINMLCQEAGSLSM